MEETVASESKSVEMHLFINSLKKKTCWRETTACQLCLPLAGSCFMFMLFMEKTKKIFNNFFHAWVKIQLSTFPEIKEKENTHAIS